MVNKLNKIEAAVKYCKILQIITRITLYDIMYYSRSRCYIANCITHEMLNKHVILKQWHLVKSVLQKAIF